MVRFHLATVRLAAANFWVNERAGQAVITVTLSDPTSQEVTVQYATSAGTATVGTDYAQTQGTLTFAAQETSQTFSVPILGDFDPEHPDETITITISNPNNAELWPPSKATLTIVDDDWTPEDSPPGYLPGDDGSCTCGSGLIESDLGRMGRAEGSFSAWRRWPGLTAPAAGAAST